MVNSFNTGRMDLDAIKTAAAHLPAQSISQLPSVFDQGNYALTGHASTLQTSMEATAYQWTGPAANAATTAVLATSTQGVMSADASQVASSMTTDFMTQLYETQNAVAAIQPVDTSQAAAIRKAGGPAVIALIPSAAVAAQRALSAEAKARQQQAANLMNKLNDAASDFAEVQPTVFPVIPVPRGPVDGPPFVGTFTLQPLPTGGGGSGSGYRWDGSYDSVRSSAGSAAYTGATAAGPALGSGPVTAQEALTLSPMPIPPSSDNTIAAVGPTGSGGLSSSAGAIAGTTAVAVGLLGGGAVTGVGQDTVTRLTGGRLGAAPGATDGGSNTPTRPPTAGNSSSSGNSSGGDEGRLNNPNGSGPGDGPVEEPVTTARPAADPIDERLPATSAGEAAADERLGNMGAPNVASAGETELNRRYPVAGLDGEPTAAPNSATGQRISGGASADETELNRSYPVGGPNGEPTAAPNSATGQRISGGGAGNESIGNRPINPGLMNDEGELLRVGPNGLPTAGSSSSYDRGLNMRYSPGDTAMQAELRPNSLSAPNQDLHAGEPMPRGGGGHRNGDDDDELRAAPAYLKEPDDFWGDGRLVAPQVIDWNYKIDDEGRG